MAGETPSFLTVPVRIVDSKASKFLGSDNSYTLRLRAHFVEQHRGFYVDTIRAYFHCLALMPFDPRFPKKSGFGRI